MNAISTKSVLLAATAAVILGGTSLPQQGYAFGFGGGGFYCTNCATFYQQLQGYAESVNTQLNTARQLATQIQQYNDMVQQGLSLPTEVFDSISTSIGDVAAVYNNSKALGRNISNLDQRFQSEFEGYSSYIQNATTGAFGASGALMPGRYEAWADAGFDNARTAMKAAGMNVGTFQSEDNVLQQLVQRSTGAAGRMQAIQAGNEIAAQNVQQLQKLRDLLATQITAQSNYMALETERMALDQAQQEIFQGSVPNNTNQGQQF